MDSRFSPFDLKGKKLDPVIYSKDCLANLVPRVFRLPATKTLGTRLLFSL